MVENSPQNAQNCTIFLIFLENVNSIANHYDNTLSTILDKHAPLKKICIVDRPMNDWMNADIQALKVIRRNKEDIWRKKSYCY